MEGTPRDVIACVRFTGDAAARLEKGRGTMNRSDFVRTAVEEKIQREARKRK